MPFKFYHGKTGRVFNVTKRAVGVIVNKPIRYCLVILEYERVKSTHEFGNKKGERKITVQINCNPTRT